MQNIPCSIVYLSDAVPMDDHPLGVQRVLELDDDGVAGLGAYRRAGELPVDPDEDLLLAIRRPEHVAHLPFEVPGLGCLRTMWKSGTCQEASKQEHKKPHWQTTMARLQRLVSGEKVERQNGKRA